MAYRLAALIKLQRCLVDHAVLHRQVGTVSTQHVSAKSDCLAVSDVFLDQVQSLRVVVDEESGVAAYPEPRHVGIVVREVPLLLNRAEIGAVRLIRNAGPRRRTK